MITNDDVYLLPPIKQKYRKKISKTGSLILNNSITRFGDELFKLLAHHIDPSSNTIS